MTAHFGGRLGKRASGVVCCRCLSSWPVLPRDCGSAQLALPVVSYALPALIAIGHARFHHVPPAWWNPLRWIRQWAWKRVRPMLRELQPSTGGYLEVDATDQLCDHGARKSAGEKIHPCVPHAVEFLQRSMRADGSWPIDTNLATLGHHTLGRSAGRMTGRLIRRTAAGRRGCSASNTKRLILSPTPLLAVGHGPTCPSGVPDADDAAGTLIALWHLCDHDDERRSLAPQASAGVQWLLDLQNRDGGMPTFCRGWGTLPFDRSARELAAHALWAWRLWHPHLPARVQQRR